MLDTAAVQTMISVGLTSTSSLVIVDTIAERDELVFAGDSSVYVRNTSDAEKPVSVIQSQALALKADKTELSSYVNALGSKSDVGHGHAISSINGLSIALTTIETNVSGLGTGYNTLSSKFVALEDKVNSIAVPNSFPVSAVVGLVGLIDSINMRIVGKANTDHRHTASHITDFDQAVNGVIDQHSFAVVGSSAW